MPRTARARSASGIYHVMVRGISGEDIFRDNGDRAAYLNILSRVRDKAALTVYGYCLMDNHVHILLAEGNEPLGASMKRIGVAYAVSFNKKYDRNGYLFQNRFRSEPVEDDAYFLTVLRYIHQNPIKAGLCTECGAYAWSSYRTYAYRQGPRGLLNTDFAIALLGGLRPFLQFTNAHNEDSCLEIENRKPMSDDELREELDRLLSDLNHTLISQLSIANRNQIIRRLKELEGTTIRQIVAVTGLSKNIVARA